MPEEHQSRTSAAQTQEIEQDPSTEGATTQTQADVREESKSDNKLHDEAIPIDTDSLETLQKKWELGSFGGSDSTNTPSPKTILGARKRAESTREKPTRNRRTRRSRATGLSGRRPGRAPARNKGKFMPPGRPHILERPMYLQELERHPSYPQDRGARPGQGSVYEHVEHSATPSRSDERLEPRLRVQIEARNRRNGQGLRIIPESIGFVRRWRRTPIPSTTTPTWTARQALPVAVVNILGRTTPR